MNEKRFLPFDAVRLLNPVTYLGRTIPAGSIGRVFTVQSGGSGLALASGQGVIVTFLFDDYETHPNADKWEKLAANKSAMLGVDAANLEII